MVHHSVPPPINGQRASAITTALVSQMPRRGARGRGRTDAATTSRANPAAALGERLDASMRNGQAVSTMASTARRSEEHTSELQSRLHLVCRLLLEKKKSP